MEEVLKEFEMYAKYLALLSVVIPVLFVIMAVHVSKIHLYAKKIVEENEKQRVILQGFQRDIKDLK